MSRSSTSSSDPPTRGRWPKGAALAVVLLLILEFGAARQQWLWDFVLASPAGVITALETQVIDGAAPEVVVMGSSRVRDGVSPRHLERELGLGEGSVLNLAVTNGSTFDALTLYRRNRSVLSKAKVLIVGIEDRTFNAGWAPNDRDRRYMTLGERMGAYNHDHTLSLMAGWIWRTYDARGPIDAALKSMAKGRSATLPIAADGRVKWRNEEIEVGPEKLPDPDAFQKFYQNWEATDGRRRFLDTLIELASKDKVKVMVIKLPWRAEHLALIQTHHPKEFAEYRRRASSIQTAPVVLWEAPGELGMKETDFYDYGHPTIRGAIKITTALANEVERRQMMSPVD